MRSSLSPWLLSSALLFGSLACSPAADHDPSSETEASATEGALDTTTQNALRAQRYRFLSLASAPILERTETLAAMVKSKLAQSPDAAPFDLAKVAMRDLASNGGFPTLGSYKGTDIEALAFFVLMEAAKEAQDDLKQIMDGVKAVNAQKEGLRKSKSKIDDMIAAVKEKADSEMLALQDGDCFTPTNPCTLALSGANGSDVAYEGVLIKRLNARLFDSVPHTVGDLRKLQARVQGKLDSLTDMSDLESLRMQMLMDRKTKLDAAVSNLLKKMAETSSSIVQNLK